MRCDFPCNSCLKGVAKQVASMLQGVNAFIATYLATFLSLHRLHKEDLGSTFCNDCIEVLKPIQCKLHLEIATCKMSSKSCCGYFPNVARQVARKIASCNASFIKRATLMWTENLKIHEVSANGVRK